jgi:hypothetical protein
MKTTAGHGVQMLQMHFLAVKNTTCYRVKPPWPQYAKNRSTPLEAVKSTLSGIKKSHLLATN